MTDKTDKLLSQTETARRLGVTTMALWKWRAKGTGPAFIYITTGYGDGRTAKYPESAVNAYAAEHADPDRVTAIGLARVYGSIKELTDDELRTLISTNLAMVKDSAPYLRLSHFFGEFAHFLTAELGRREIITADLDQEPSTEVV